MTQYSVIICYIHAGHCANKATAAFMEETSKKIVHIEIGTSADVEYKSARLEKHLVELGLEYLQTHTIGIKEVISDASSAVIHILGNIIYNECYFLQRHKHISYI